MKRHSATLFLGLIAGEVTVLAAAVSGHAEEQSLEGPVGVAVSGLPANP